MNRDKIDGLDSSRVWIFKKIIYEEDIVPLPDWRDHVLMWLPKRVNGYLIKEKKNEKIVANYVARYPFSRGKPGYLRRPISDL